MVGSTCENPTPGAEGLYSILQCHGPTDISGALSNYGGSYRKKTKGTLQTVSARIKEQLRTWQSKALTKYLLSRPKDFLAVATPGAGKTTFALRVATELLDNRTVDRVIVVVLPNT